LWTQQEHRDHDQQHRRRGQIGADPADAGQHTGQYPDQQAAEDRADRTLQPADDHRYQAEHQDVAHHRRAQQQHVGEQHPGDRAGHRRHRPAQGVDAGRGDADDARRLGVVRGGAQPETHLGEAEQPDQ
jgi:hypothetical protein